MIKCDVCGYNNADTATFCLQCGAPITRQKVSEAIDDISGEKTLVIDSRAFSGNKPGAAPAAPAPPMGGPMKLPPPTLPKSPAAAPTPAPVQMAAPAAPAPAPRPAAVIPESAPDVPRTSIPPTTTSLPTVPPAVPIPARAAAPGGMPKWVIPVIGVLALLVVVLIVVVILK